MGDIENTAAEYSACYDVCHLSISKFVFRLIEINGPLAPLPTF